MRISKAIAYMSLSDGFLVLGMSAAGFKDAALVRYYIWRLRSEDVAVRRNAVDRLGVIGSEASIQPLMKLLAYDKDKGVRESTVLAIENFGSKALLHLSN